MGARSQKRIISASRRTDIPAFYAEWFMERLRAGYCTVANPYNAKQIFKVSLKPQDVLGFVFWTRNAQPLLKYLPELDKKKYQYYFQYTLIGYPRQIEPYCPSLDSAIKVFKKLSRAIGKEQVIWRYDPILLSNKLPQGWHIKRISYLMKALKGYTERLVISFIDRYRKIERRMPKGIVYDPAAYDKITRHIADQAKKYGLQVQTCAEKIDLSEYGITHGKCIDDKMFHQGTVPSPALKKDPYQREACGCVVSKDIGTNNTCRFGCKYCYASSHF